MSIKKGFLKTALSIVAIASMVFGICGIPAYAADTDKRILYTELVVGANHPSITDVTNRPLLAFHDNAGRHLFKGGSTVASAATIAVPDDSNYFLVSGSVTISAISAKSTGAIVVIKFDSAIRLTHNATSLICPNARDLALDAGAVVTLHEYSSGNWRVLAVEGGEIVSNENLIINGAFDVAQRGTSFTSATTPANSDDTYLMDRWVLLSDGNDIVDVSQSVTAPPTRQLYSIGLDTETIDKKFGILQIIEAKDAVKIIGGKASLSFDAKVTSAAAGRIDNIKAVVLAWNSTADVVTSDVVSAWNAEDTTPTWAANWTAENTPANLGVTTSWATYKIENISIDTASATNVAIFIWCDAFSGTLTDFLNITKVKLNPGSTATPFENRPYQQELALCQRYFWKSFPAATAPAQNAGVTGAITFPITWTGIANNITPTVSYPVPMRAIPTVTFYNPSAANAFARNSNTSTDSTTLTLSVSSDWGLNTYATGIAGWAVGHFGLFHATAIAEL